MNSNHGKSGRWTRASFLVLIVVASLVLAACGSDDAEVDTQATEIAAGVAATLEAQAALTPVVIVVTPPPPTEPVGASAAPPAGIDLANLRLEADGSGDLPTLEDAIVQSPEGATITLGPGTYRLEHALTVGGSLHLVGAGRDQTRSSPTWPIGCCASRAADHSPRRASPSATMEMRPPRWWMWSAARCSSRAAASVEGCATRGRHRQRSGARGLGQR